MLFETASADMENPPPLPKKQPYQPVFDKNRPPKYYTPAEVAIHNTAEDLWVSWLGNVYNLTILSKKHKGSPLMIPILKNAGQDISHWFDKDTGDLKTHVHALSNLRVPYIPDGRFVDVPPVGPRSDWPVSSQLPWWEDHQEYWIGRLTTGTRKIKLVNTLTKDEHVLEVCKEETISAIQERYLSNNAHAKGYMWKRLGNLLDMSMNLEENGVIDERETFEKLGLNDEEFMPAIHLYFSDDLTVA